MTEELKQKIIKHYREGQSVKSIFLDLVPYFDEAEIQQVIDESEAKPMRENCKCTLKVIRGTSPAMMAIDRENCDYPRLRAELDQACGLLDIVLHITKHQLFTSGRSDYPYFEIKHFLESRQEASRDVSQ